VKHMAHTPEMTSSSSNRLPHCHTSHVTCLFLTCDGRHTFCEFSHRKSTCDPAVPSSSTIATQNHTSHNPEQTQLNIINNQNQSTITNFLYSRLINTITRKMFTSRVAVRLMGGVSARNASTLVVAEHAGGKLGNQTLAAVTAATKIGGPVSVLDSMHMRR
jgi:hypothetical protein